MSKTKKKHTILFQPSGKLVVINSGTSIREASILLDINIEGGCGDQGTCGKCKVRIEEGVFEEHGIVSNPRNLSPISTDEREFISRQEEQKGYRLACQAQVYGDIVVFVPEESLLNKQVIRKEARDIKVTLNPAVKKYYIDLTESTMDDHTSDWERLKHSLQTKHRLEHLVIDCHVLRSIQRTIRDSQWKVTAYVWNNREVIAIAPGNVKKSYGLAIDIGTTTLAGYLCDLSTGKLITTVSTMNPQVIYGEDVMSRICFTLTNPDGLDRLKQSVLDGIQQLIADACAIAGISSNEILDMVAVGNTCMHHISLGIDPRYIGKAPFTPALQCSLDMKARDIGIQIAPGAYVHILPIEAGFVGADNVAVLIAEEPYNQEKMELIIDIGTNGELILGNSCRILSCSCGAGPAFEGAEIKHGMRAAPGAIERIVIDRKTKEVSFKVIGQDEWNGKKQAAGAKGICGSGIIDIVPQLYLAGIIDRTGRFLPNVNSPRFREVNGMPEFVIAWSEETRISRDIVISQKDVRAIQLAKAAMYAGVKIMMAELGISRIDKVILAGAFGSYIHKESAALLGLFPDCDIEDVVAVGNAAGDGARLALLNVEKRKEAEKMSRNVEYVELTLSPDFDRLFAQAMWIPHMTDKFPHLKGIIP